MKRSLTAIFIALCLLCTVAVSGENSFASTSTYKYLTVKENTWTTLKKSDINPDGSEIYNKYKINVPAHGALNISIQSKGCTLYVYDLFTDNNRNLVAYITKKGTYSLAVDKGTYYLDPLYTSKDISLKYSFKPVKATQNYCIRKASTLKPGKKVTVCMSRKKCYDRWYKIKLKKQQKINFWTNGVYSIVIYDSDFIWVNTRPAGTGNSKYMTRKKLEKGTYYISVKRNIERDYDNGTVSQSNANSVITLKWK